MMSSLGSSTQPVFIQQQASGGVQLILRSQQQTTGPASAQVQSAQAQASGKPVVLGSSGNLASPGTVFITHPQVSLSPQPQESGFVLATGLPQHLDMREPSL